MCCLWVHPKQRAASSSQQPAASSRRPCPPLHACDSGRCGCTHLDLAMAGAGPACALQSIGRVTSPAWVSGACRLLVPPPAAEGRQPGGDAPPPPRRQGCTHSVLNGSDSHPQHGPSWPALAVAIGTWPGRQLRKGDLPALGTV